MTEPLIKLPSVIIRELQAEIADQKAELDSKDAEIKDKDDELQSSKAEIKRLQKLVAQLSSDKHMP